MLPARTLAGLLLGLAVLAGGVAWQYAATSSPDAVPASTDVALQRLLALELPDAQGRPQALAQWRGRPLLINFWATWCAPCREEMPLLGEIARQQPAGGLQVLGIAWDSAANVADYAGQHRAVYPLLVADARATALLAALGNPAQGLPFSLLVGADGRVRRVRLGAFQAAELHEILVDHSVANGSKMR
jgi:thiol-disulfide isomerase/thioredoxin